MALNLDHDTVGGRGRRTPKDTPLTQNTSRGDVEPRPGDPPGLEGVQGEDGGGLVDGQRDQAPVRQVEEQPEVGVGDREMRQLSFFQNRVAVSKVQKNTTRPM